MTDSHRPVVLDARVVTGTGGGPDKTILNSPRCLDALGYRMLCAYLRPPNDAGFDAIRQRANQIDASLIEIDDRGPLDRGVFFELLKLCRRENVAIYHGHDYKTNLLGLLLKRFHPMQLVTTVHGWVHHTARTPLYYRVDKFCLRRYEKVICVSDDLVAECRRIGVDEQRLMQLENGIDLAAYQRTTSIAEAKARLGFDPSRPLVGAVGRLSPEKGFDLLIEAAAKLAVPLVIVGGGPEETRLREIAGKEVRLAGFQGDPRPFFEALDVFALSSLREALPNVLLESMAMGVPCVATRVGGVARMIDDGFSGRLVAAGDVDALAAGIGELLRDESLLRRFSEAGRRVVEERFSFGRRMERLAALYDDILSRRGVAECTAS